MGVATVTSSSPTRREHSTNLAIRAGVAKIPILWTLGIVVLVVGVVLFLLGSAGRTVGGRRHYW
ncbi:MAG TPA: DUF6131 family protein [Acidothermaceae bacterium]